MKTVTMVLALMMSTLMVISQITESPELVKVETKDSNEFVGAILDESDVKIVLSTEMFDEITIRKEVIVKIRPVDKSKLVGDEFWDDNLQSTRYLWKPNGYGLRKGEGYYQNIWVLYNQVSYGFTNYFSVSAGIIPVFLFAEDIFGPVWLIPKLSLPIKKDVVNVAAGAFIGTVAGESETGFGIVFSTLTIGDRSNNCSIGIGWGYSEGEWADRPMLNISGMHRVSAKGYLLTENYYLSLLGEDIAILSAGYRHMSKKVGIDFGLYVPLYKGVNRLFGVPVVGVTIPFTG